MGWARPEQSDTGVKMLPVAPKTGATPLAPTPQTISDGTYPLSRPLYFYTTKPEEPGVSEFIDFVESDAGQKIVSQRGFTALPAKNTPSGKGSAGK
jgi:phosphate transport system substrate-binding protein